MPRIDGCGGLLSNRKEWVFSWNSQRQAQSHTGLVPKTQEKPSRRGHHQSEGAKPCKTFWDYEREMKWKTRDILCSENGRESRKLSFILSSRQLSISMTPSMCCSRQWRAGRGTHATPSQRRSRGLWWITLWVFLIFLFNYSDFSPFFSKGLWQMGCLGDRASPKIERKYWTWTPLFRLSWKRGEGKEKGGKGGGEERRRDSRELYWYFLLCIPSRIGRLEIKILRLKSLLTPKEKFKSAYVEVQLGSGPPLQVVQNFVRVCVCVCVCVRRRARRICLVFRRPRTRTWTASPYRSTSTKTSSYRQLFRLKKESFFLTILLLLFPLPPQADSPSDKLTITLYENGKSTGSFVVPISQVCKWPSTTLHLPLHYEYFLSLSLFLSFFSLPQLSDSAPHFTWYRLLSKKDLKRLASPKPKRCALRGSLEVKGWFLTFITGKGRMSERVPVGRRICFSMTRMTRKKRCDSISRAFANTSFSLIIIHFLTVCLRQKQRCRRCMCIRTMSSVMRRAWMGPPPPAWGGRMCLIFENLILIIIIMISLWFLSEIHIYSIGWLPSPSLNCSKKREDFHEMYNHLLQRIIDATDGLLSSPSPFHPSYLPSLSLAPRSPFSRDSFKITPPLDTLSLLSLSLFLYPSISHSLPLLSFFHSSGMMTQFDPTVTWVLTEFCRRYAVSEAYRGEEEEREGAIVNEFDSFECVLPMTWQLIILRLNSSFSLFISFSLSLFLSFKKFGISLFWPMRGLRKGVTWPSSSRHSAGVTTLILCVQLTLSTFTFSLMILISLLLFPSLPLFFSYSFIAHLRCTRITAKNSRTVLTQSGGR